MTDRESVVAKAETFWLEALLLVFAYLLMLVSAAASIKTNDPLWFSRSGSLVVLISVIIEYRNLTVQQKLNEIAQESTAYRNAEPEKWRVPTSRKSFDLIVRLTIVVGTVVWGYGDLLF